MDAVLLATALQTVEQDHQLVVDRIQALRELVAALLDPRDIDAPLVFGRLRDLDNYFFTQFVTHMDEEEKTLFPLLQRFSPEGSALVDRLRQEHTTLRRTLDDFTNCLKVAIELEDRPPQVVLRDLLTYAWELWEGLDKHAHEETRGIQECLDRSLAAELAPPKAE
jgi:hemerythrin-like domain-containing protein